MSIATVSRVFNDSHRVSPKTRERVLEVARGLNYQPHVSAQSLARQNSHLISAVIPVVANYFYMEIIRGMQDALAKSDYDLIVYVAPKPEAAGSQLDRAMQKGRSEGLLLLSTPISETRVKRLRAMRRPVVVVDALHPDFDSISIDNRKGGFMATKHLIDAGYDRVAHITINPEAPPAADRRRGYEEALRSAGKAVEKDYIAASGKQPFGFVEESGYEAMLELLKCKPRPDAVFVASDIQALGALRALKENGLTAPDDIAVIGFDDIQISEHIGLTTLRQPIYEMGTLAVEKLLHRIRHPEHPTTNTVFSPSFVGRSTCGSSLAQSAAASRA